jgi:hypothetical protein
LTRLADLKADFDMLDSYFSANNYRNGIFINIILAVENLNMKYQCG